MQVKCSHTSENNFSNKAANDIHRTTMDMGDKPETTDWITELLMNFVETT